MSLASWLKNGPLVTDGGWGTELQARGLPIGSHPDLWNLTNPDAVFDVANSYLEAGSDIILTNTFGATTFALAHSGMVDRVREINIRGAEISRRAAEACTQRIVRVFASMGPTGVLLMMGQVSQEELFDAFLVQATALKEGGADAIVIETMSDPTELSIAIRAAKTTGLPVVGSMTFDTGKGKDRTMMGTSPEQAVEVMTQAGADAVGANCGQGIEGFLGITRRYRAVTSLPIWIKGNAGLPQVVAGQTIYGQSPELFAQFIPPLIEAGANFVGGCCGTNPSFIVAVRRNFGSIIS